MVESDQWHDPVGERLPAPVRPTALHMLRHPDRQTTWAGAGVMRFDPPLAGGDPGLLQELLGERVTQLHAAYPVAGARLRGVTWYPGTPGKASISADDQPIPPTIMRPFNLACEPPLRLLAHESGKWLTVVPHHAAIDGASVMGMFKLLSGLPPRPIAPRRVLQRRSVPPWASFRRLLWPADPVAPSPTEPAGDTFVHAALPPIGRGSTGRLPQALVAAVTSHNLRSGQPLRRIGISLSVAELDDGVGVASYRRIDLHQGEPVATAVEAALRAPEEPWEIVHAPRAIRLLAPVAGRLSDTILLSNFGRIELAGVTSLEIYPVARGRSAVAFGAVRVASAGSTLTLRAQHLSTEDATHLLHDAIALL